MSCRLTVIYSKPNDETNWHTPIVIPPAIAEKYADKRLVYKVDPQGNLLHLEVIFDSRETHDAFMAEVEIATEFEAMRLYHEANGIDTVGRELEDLEQSFQSFVTSMGD